MRSSAQPTRPPAMAARISAARRGCASRRPPWTGYRATVVDFAPGTRNDWHHHPGGQVLFVLTGHGRVVAQRVDGLHEETFGPGDIVVAEPGECHWHGATDDSFMSHLSVTAEDTLWGNARADEPPDCAKN